MRDEPFRSGTIALLGRPNVGKSTLLNHIIGAKVAIVTPKPQTTRHRILGIRTDRHSQMVFVDTPGIHQSGQQLNRNMVRVAYAAAEEADVLAILQDVSKPLDAGTRRMIERLTLEARGKPRVHVLNKIDQVRKEALLPRLALTQQIDPDARGYVPISARKGQQVEALLALLADCLPESPPLYDPEWFTDQSQRQLAAEYVREQVFMAMQQEVPFQTAVEIERFVEHAPQDGRAAQLEIDAAILVGSERHKPMLIGKGGANLKRIGTVARQGLERLLNCRVHLNLWVKVEPEWYNRPGQLRELGLGD
jgi:GTPase